MFEFLTIFILLYLLAKVHVVKIVYHRFDGYYLYYQVKEFEMYYKEFRPVVKKKLLWSTKSNDEEESIF
jgi:hypothetical protein